MKHAICIILFVFVYCFNLYGTTDKQRSYTPENTAIAFDIDQVLIGPTYKQWKYVWQYRMALIRSIADVSLLKQIIRYWWNDKPADAYIALFKQKKRPQLALFLKALITSREPLPHIVTIVKELKAAGYELALATNESPAIFALNKRAHTTLFALFDTALCASHEKPVIKKPEASYYKKLQARIGNKKIIFIDDRKENIKGAEQCGITGIHFITAHQLRYRLTSYSILSDTISPIKHAIIYVAHNLSIT